MSTKIAVISDSHVGQRISAYPRQILDVLRGADIVVHAGDHTNHESLEAIRNLGDLKAVRGNMDEVAVCSELPNKLLFEVDGILIGVTHGSGAPLGLEKRVLDEFSVDDPKPDIIIFGHSHRPGDDVHRGIRMLNPGSLSGNLFNNKGSYGILTIDNGSVAWKIFEIEV